VFLLFFEVGETFYQAKLRHFGLFNICGTCHNVASVQHKQNNPAR
jgi:hypothetical protein